MIPNIVLQGEIQQTLFTVSVTALAIIPAIVTFAMEYYVAEKRKKVLTDDNFKTIKWLIAGLTIGLWLIYTSLIINVTGIIGIKQLLDLEVSYLGSVMFFMVAGITIISVALTTMVIKFFEWW